MTELNQPSAGLPCPREQSAGYRALTQTAGLLELSARGRLCILGSDREKFLHGQVTNDVKRLRVGQGCYAALVNAKAKMEADLFVYKLKEELLLDFEPGLTERLSQRLEKYIISEDVQVLDVAPHYGLLSIQGPKAAEAVAVAGFRKPAPERALDFVSWEEECGEVYLVNQPRLGTSGYDLFIPTELCPAYRERLTGAVARTGGSDADEAAFELARIEAGIPRFGVDMDETNLPQEAEIQDRAISFSKGCYIGQEIIARIRTYGQVAKTLRLLQFETTNPRPKGTKLFRDGKEIGYVTSAVFSPRFGKLVGLGYVRREANELGTELRLGTVDGPSVSIIGLPGTSRGGKS